DFKRICFGRLRYQWSDILAQHMTRCFCEDRPSIEHHASIKESRTGVAVSAGFGSAHLLPVVY
ncbi:hypothetical protein ABTM70_20185, partial [Acinetobacter baumannii]